MQITGIKSALLSGLLLLAVGLPAQTKTAIINGGTGASTAAAATANLVTGNPVDPSSVSIGANLIIPTTATLPYSGWKVFSGSGSPTDPCSSTQNTGAFEINSSLDTFQCSNAGGTYVWNALVAGSPYPGVSSSGTGGLAFSGPHSTVGISINCSSGGCPFPDGTSLTDTTVDTQFYEVNGSLFSTINLNDWTDTGSVINYVATCTTVVTGNCTAWAPRPPSVNVNSTPVFAPNFNGATPSVASTVGINGVFQVSSANISVYTPVATGGTPGAVQPDGTTCAVTTGTLTCIGKISNGNNANGYWVEDAVSHFHEWGTVVCGGSDCAVTFPQNFVTVGSIVPQLTSYYPTGDTGYFTIVSGSITTSGFTVHQNNLTGMTLYWSADGY